jgi:hypothetical protein
LSGTAVIAEGRFDGAGDADVGVKSVEALGRPFLVINS